jgi:energy-coupling factor transporter ATP-binding protein EcfA2
MEPRYSLEIKDATVAYNRVPAIHHLNLKIEGGHCVALMGPNGAGKTTLLKTIAGLLTVETGEITFHGHGLKRVANEIAYLPQREQVDWDFPITVRGLVEMGCYIGLGWWRRFGAGAPGGGGPGDRDDAFAEPCAPADQRALGRAAAAGLPGAVAGAEGADLSAG